MAIPIVVTFLFPHPIPTLPFSLNPPPPPYHHSRYFAGAMMMGSVLHLPPPRYTDYLQVYVCHDVCIYPLLITVSICVVYDSCSVLHLPPPDYSLICIVYDSCSVKHLSPPDCSLHLHSL